MSDRNKKNQPTEQDIKERAYEMWEEAGRPDGQHEQFWNKAEKELIKESGRSRN